jgi:hypothetical protein
MELLKKLYEEYEIAWMMQDRILRANPDLAIHRKSYLLGMQDLIHNIERDFLGKEMSSFDANLAIIGEKKDGIYFKA